MAHSFLNLIIVFLSLIVLTHHHSPPASGGREHRECAAVSLRFDLNDPWKSCTCSIRKDSVMRLLLLTLTIEQWYLLHGSASTHNCILKREADFWSGQVSVTEQCHKGCILFPQCLDFFLIFRNVIIGERVRSGEIGLQSGPQQSQDMGHAYS